MINLFRISLCISVVALAVALLVPFGQPYEASFPIDQPPMAPMFMALCAILAIVFVPIASYGLLRFRRWAPKLAAFTAVPLIGLALVTAFPTDIGSVVSVSGRVLPVIAAILWVLALALTKAPSVRQRFVAL